MKIELEGQRVFIFFSLKYIFFRPKGLPCVIEPVDPPCRTGKNGKKLVPVEKSPKISTSLGNCLIILSTFEIEWKKLHSKTIPTGIFRAGNKRFSIPIGISIKIFIPTERKSSTGALRQGCFKISILL